MARARLSARRLFSKRDGFAISYRGSAVPAATYHGAMKAAVKQVKRAGDVVHVLAKDKRRGGGFSTLATCMPKWKTMADLERWERGKKKPVACTVHIKVKKRR